MSVFVSTGAFQSRDLREILDIALNEGISRIELSSGLEYTEDMIPLVRRESDRFEFRLHNYFPPPSEPFVLNLASNDARTVEHSLSMCRQAVDLASELGIGFYSLHCGFAFQPSEADLGNESQAGLKRLPRREAQENFVARLRTVCRYAKKRNLQIAIENNVVAEFAKDRPDAYLGVTAEDLAEIKEAVGCDNLRFLLDLAHAKVSATHCSFRLGDMVEKVKDDVIAVHASDNDGRRDQNLPVEKGSDVLAMLKSLHGKDIVLEAYRLEPSAIREQAKLLAQAAGGTDPA